VDKRVGKTNFAAGFLRARKSLRDPGSICVVTEVSNRITVFRNVNLNVFVDPFFEGGRA
jgi:hypothetical protein